MLETFIGSTILLLVLLNPFMLTVYLLDVIRETTMSELRAVLVRACLISGVVFLAFAVGGDRMFGRLLQVRFASFQVFGGVLFLVIAIRFIINGTETMVMLRGEPGKLAGAIAMPFMIGPGTVSASMLAGARLPLGWATGAIVVAVAVTLVAVLVLKRVHDRVKERHEPLVERYVDIVGRISALIIGTVAVDMIFRGIEGWMTGHDI